MAVSRRLLISCWPSVALCPLQRPLSGSSLRGCDSGSDPSHAWNLTSSSIPISFASSLRKFSFKELMNRNRLTDLENKLVFSHSVVSDSAATPQTVARQAPLSMGSPRQEYWGGLPFPSSIYKIDNQQGPLLNTLL